ncbi:Nitrogen assimilation transcription factor nit-4 [Fusarium oxysporum f. sp. raphani]|nr:Nitrogen assimilation transcription factor nit-4 [Fusarium oxysporum f. sp. raphani]
MRPSCSTCIAAGRECRYAAHPHELQSAAIKRKYDELQERMIDHEKLYDTLRTRQPVEVEEILRRIQAGGDVKSVTEDIQEGDLLLELTSPPAFIPQQLPARSVPSHQAVPYGPLAGDPQAQLPVREGTISFDQPRLTSPYDHPEHIFEEAWRETQYRYAEDRVFIDLPGYTLPISRWTTVSNDDKLLSHLLMLFWTWDTICSGVIDRTIFEEDLKSLDPSSPSSSPPDMLLFCSPFLVNALLAVSCLYTKNQATFHMPGDPNSRGKAFAIEAARLLALEDTSPSLPVAQGLALMYVYEGALGSGGTALSYHSRMQARYLALRLDEIPRSADAAIAGVRQRREAHALSWIAWGFYIWDWKPMHGLCRRLVIRKPRRPKTWHDEATSPLCNKGSPGYWWFPYPVSVIPQNALKREIFDAECDLAEITEQVLDFLIPLEEGWPPRRNTHRALELYTELTRWKYSLSERLRVENAVLPSAILLHLNVELLIMSVLRPFDGLTKEEFGPFDPVTISYAHASNAMWVVWHFRALYTLRNEHWIIQAASICAFRVLFGIETSTIQLETFAKACRALIELSESFPVAKEVILSIDSVVKKQRLELPSYANEHLSSHAGGTIDELTAVKVRDHSVIVEKADSQGHSDHLTLTGLLSSVAPRDTGPD